MRIALLGSGLIMSALVKSIVKQGHTIMAIGTNHGASFDCWELDKVGLQPIVLQDYTQVCDMNIDVVVMYSYAPLVSSAYLFKKKFINIHYALLPRYRGFHGFIWSMLNDEPRMGYSVHLIDEGIDSGPIFFQHAIDINDKMNINDVRVLLDHHLVENIGRYLTEIEHGKKPIQQDEHEAIYVTRRKPEDGLINWNWPARLIFNHIRALTPPSTPGAYSFHKGQKITFTKAEWIDRPKYFASMGKIVCIDIDGSMLVKCADNVVKITEIDLNGMRILPGEYFKRVGQRFD